MNKRKFLGTIGAAVVGAMLSVGLKPIKQVPVLNEPDLVRRVLVEWQHIDGKISHSVVEMPGRVYTAFHALNECMVADSHDTIVVNEWRMYEHAAKSSSRA